MGKYDEARKLLLQTREVQLRFLGPGDPETALSTYNLACIASRQGNRKEAIGLLDESIHHGLDYSLDLGLTEDADLMPLHGDAGFEALVREAGKLGKSAGDQKK